MVDEKKIAFNPAYELSFLKPEEQQVVCGGTVDEAMKNDIAVAERCGSPLPPWMAS